MSNNLISRRAVIDEIDELMKSIYANSILLGAVRRETIETVKILCVESLPAAYDENEKIEMIKLEDGAYVPRECCSITNPLTSGGKSEIDDIDMPCGADCGGECSSCVIQKILNEYAKLTGQEEGEEMVK